MALDRKSRFNLLIGLVLTTLVTWPTFELLFAGDAKQPLFLPINAWLWPALLILLLCGLLISLFGLMRKVHWGYFLWSQTTLSFWVLIIYLGRSRADRDYARSGADPDAIYQGPPEVLWYRFVFLVLVWLVIGFLPLVLMNLWTRHKARKSRSGQEGTNSSVGN